jgi:hypothetical protein
MTRAAAPLTVVERFLHETDPDRPFAIAKRTYDYLTTCGGGRLV